jgi:hypothetical protein
MWLLLLIITGMVLARHYWDQFLTSFVGYIKHPNLWILSVRCGIDYTMEQQVF